MYIRKRSSAMSVSWVPNSRMPYFRDNSFCWSYLMNWRDSLSEIHLTYSVHSRRRNNDENILFTVYEKRDSFAFSLANIFYVFFLRKSINFQIVTRHFYLSLYQNDYKTQDFITSSYPSHHQKPKTKNQKVPRIPNPQLRRHSKEIKMPKMLVFCCKCEETFEGEPVPGRCPCGHQVAICYAISGCGGLVKVPSWLSEAGGFCVGEEEGEGKGEGERGRGKNWKLESWIDTLSLFTENLCLLVGDLPLRYIREKTVCKMYVIYSEIEDMIYQKRRRFTCLFHDFRSMFVPWSRDNSFCEVVGAVDSLKIPFLVTIINWPWGSLVSLSCPTRHQTSCTRMHRWTYRHHW